MTLDDELCLRRRPVIEPYLARPRPAAFIAALDEIFFSSSGTQSFETDTVRAQFRERWLGRYLSHDPQLAFVAVCDAQAADAKPAGYIVGSLDDPARAPRFSDLAYFQDLAHLTERFPAQLHINLAEAFRGQGLGQALVAAFVARVRAEGAPGVHAVTGRGMRNVHFYEACGFQEAGACVWNGRDLVMLALAL